jgi:hypothetical protein
MSTCEDGTAHESRFRYFVNDDQDAYVLQQARPWPSSSWPSASSQTSSADGFLFNAVAGFLLVEAAHCTVNHQVQARY